MAVDSTEFVATVQNAVSQAQEVGKAAKSALDRKVENVFIVGCGGTQAIMYPGKYILDVNSRVPGHAFNAGELVQLAPKALGPRSLVILSSYTGTTPETVAAARLARERGSLVVSCVCKPDTPLGQVSDFVFLNPSNKGSSEANIVRIYCLLLGIIEKTDGFARAAEITGFFPALAGRLAEIRNEADARALDFARQYKDQSLFYVVAGGACWGQALVYCQCILEEMQWITAQPIAAGEYFHAPFEVIDEKANLLVFKGEDLSRPLVDRVMEFSSKYTRRIALIDTRDYALPGVPADLRGYFSPFVLLAVLDRFSQNLAAERKHPLTTRRYMGIVKN
jgi:fructoselysine-6-P-deglycase FrlB-like protein